MIYCLNIENEITYQNQDWDYDDTEFKPKIKTKQKKHLCTGDFFEGWKRITTQIHIRKFEEHAA